MVFDLRPHQEATLPKMHDGCILCGGVGVGKSHTAVGYYLANHVPKTVYVITSAKKRDSHDWQMLFGDVGMTSNPEVTPGAVVYVDSWENIKKYEEVENAFFIFDEQRLVGSGRWVKAFYKIAAANAWIMLSATPGDNWLDYVPVFRANGFIKNLTQFKEDHVISRWTGRYYQVQGYRQVGKLVRWRKQLLVDMPYEKHTIRHTHEVAVEYDKDKVRELVNKRWHVYEDRPLTDASELFRVMRRVVYTNPSRLEAVRRLLTLHPKLIVFYSFNYELEMLRTLNIPQTQIIKMPDGIVQLGPQATSADSSVVKSKTFSARNSQIGSGHELLTWSGSEMEMHQENPWDYLLSPEGMRENELLSTQSTHPSTGSGSSQSRSTSEQMASGSLPQNTSRSSSSPEGLRENSILSQIPSDGCEPRQQRDSDTSETTWDSQSTNKYTGPQSSTPSNTSQPETSSVVAVTEQKENECQTKHDPTQIKNSSTTTTDRESRSFETQPSGTRSERSTSPSEGSLKTSTTKKSSAQSRKSQDPCGPGSDSTSLQQFQVAEWNGHKHEDVPTTTSWVYLVQYVAGAEAWECIETDAMCFFSMPYSYKLWWQAYGRIDRLNTPFVDLNYYVLYGDSPLEKAVATSLSTKKSFNESAFAAEIGW